MLAETYELLGDLESSRALHPDFTIRRVGREWSEKAHRWYHKGLETYRMLERSSPAWVTEVVNRLKEKIGKLENSHSRSLARSPALKAAVGSH
ncbi:MAG: hypothetical protein AB1898_21685 [Acidobacteriota bacterium]